SLGDVPEILFVPDQYLGHFVEKQLGRKLVCWNGGCPIHHRLTADVVQDMKAKYPDYKLMVHPETTPEVQAEADYILATGQMIELVRNSNDQKYLVGTEEGILHALKGAAPQKDYVHLSPKLLCADMKKTTLEKVKRSLETLETVVTVPEDIAAKARKSIEAMLKL
ncbi:MAG: quinolinate synthase NadA, partial [Lentisphaeria bacterium]|nr:quinolinate synthase NadA [Lentisphaeria bacterium]